LRPHQPRRPSPPPPYTTLFRSACGNSTTGSTATPTATSTTSAGSTPTSNPTPTATTATSGPSKTVTITTDSSGKFAFSPTTLTIDRKSTRLNSSHQIISYAVFC